MPRRSVLLVDGEHSPSVVQSALDRLSSSGAEVVALVFLGGTEKADPECYPVALPLVHDTDPASALERALEAFSPDEVVDLSDDPVLTQRRREELVARAAARGVAYWGPGYSFAPPTRSKVTLLPTVAVVGTGKRTGKTAVCAEIARVLARMGVPPVVVTMGRGGPKEPVYIPPGGVPDDPTALVQLANDGLHAASDYIEDAFFTGLASVGAWRCGGGLLGEAGPNVVEDAVCLAQEKAQEAGARMILLEGSGTSIPPVEAHATVTVTPWPSTQAGSEGVDPFEGLGLYKLLVADAVVVTMCPPEAEPESLDEHASSLRSVNPAVTVVHTRFELEPSRPIRGKRVALATTAAPAALPDLEESLARRFGVEVVGASTNLSRREALRPELEELLPRAEVLLTELKAAGVDLAARLAIEAGVEVVFVENRPCPLEREPRFDYMVHRLAELAEERFEGSR